MKKETETGKKINWGISTDLQADIRLEPNACKLYVMDISLGCPFQCVYCLFSPLELLVYKLKNPGYKGDVKPLRLDPLFPGIDDTEDNIKRIMGDAGSLGVKRAVMSYLVLTPGMKENLRATAFTRAAAEALEEKTPTISQQELYSFPFDKKIEKFTRFVKICRENGIEMSVCGCKEHRFKETDFGWTCFPYFTKEKREELSRNSSFKLDTSHLKCHDLTNQA